jgi:hypothetical protein
MACENCFATAFDESSKTAFDVGICRRRANMFQKSVFKQRLLMASETAFNQRLARQSAEEVVPQG